MCTNKISFLTTFFIGFFLSSALVAEEESILDEMNIKETFILKSMSNNNFENAPYANALIESKYSGDDYDITAGLVIKKGYSDTYTKINQLSYSYLGDDYEFKIGKYVNTLGKLDYLSFANISNPTNLEFFDDENINIRKIPLLKTELVYYPDDSWKLQAIAQPFNSEHQDYTSAYVDIILNTLFPRYIDNIISGSSSSEAANDYLFVPVYNNYISPALADDIDNKQNNSSDYQLDKLGGFLVAEYVGQDATYGAIWMNRHSEVPFIKVNDTVANTIEDVNNDDHATSNFIESPEGNTSDLISGVDSYRYNQYSLYVESTLGQFGVRAEASFRDKMPVLNDYSWLSALGFGIDYKSKYIYNTLELQWLHLDYSSEDVYVGVYSARSEAYKIKNAKIFLDYYLMFGYYDNVLELTSYPNLTIKYKQYSLALQYLYSKENDYLNNASIVLKAEFE